MTINGINITGIDENNAYYFLNPLYLNITSDTKFITNVKLTFTNHSAVDAYGTELTTAQFKLQSNPQGKVYIDIADYIKTIAVYPNGYRAKVINDNIPYSLNDVSFVIEVDTREDEQTTIFNFDKLFVFGYELTQSTNIPCLNLNFNEFDELGNNIYVPFYNDSALGDSEILKRYRINSDTRKIEYYLEDLNNINVSDYVQANVSCTPIYFRFLLRSGGYSIIEFNNYTYSSSTKLNDTNRVKTQDFENKKVGYLHSNVDSDKEFTATKEFKAKFKGFVEEFIASQYVQVYNYLTNEWQEVEMLANSLPDSFDASFDVSYKFKLINSVNI